MSSPITQPQLMSDATTLSFYENFRNFLAVDSAFNESHKRQLQANRAQQKLLRLSTKQFNELSTDVHDEMHRRISSSSAPAFLPPDESLHPKRNNARKKLSFLSPSRFNDLAFDILFEIERRNPNIKVMSKLNDEELSSYSDPEPIQVSSTNIPVSSMLNNVTPPPIPPKSPPLVAEVDIVRSMSDEPVHQTPIAIPLSSHNSSSRAKHMSASTTSTFYSDAPSSTAGSELSSPRSPFEHPAKPDPNLSANIGSDIAGSHTLIFNTQSDVPKSIPEPLTSIPISSTTSQLPGLLPTKSLLVEESDEDSDHSEIEFSPHSSTPGINTALQAWSYKNSSQADITTLHPTLPAVHFSSDEENSDDDYGLAHEFNLSSIDPESQRIDPESQCIEETHTQSMNYPAQSAAFNELEAELMRGFPLQSIAEEKSPYIPPNLMRRASTTSPGEKRRSLSETMLAGIPGGIRSRSVSKSEMNTPNQSTQSVLSSEEKTFTKMDPKPSIDYTAVIKDKDSQIDALVEAGTKMEDSIAKLDAQIAESEVVKNSLVEENGRLHQMISDSEMAKDALMAELEEAKKELAAQSEALNSQLEEKSLALADMEIMHQKLKEKHAETMSKQTEFAGSSASLTSQIMLLEGRLLKQDNVSHFSGITGKQFLLTF